MNITGLYFEPQLSTDARGMTVNNFHKASTGKTSTLVLRPAFQRNLVWNPEQQSFLIDSILRGLPVPELYVQIATSADGDERYTVVDGQQRISTCLNFIDGSLRLGNSDDLDQQWRGKTFKELNDDLKANFLGFKFIVRDLPVKANDAVLREIFRRLNRTVEALQAQELRHAAFTGPFIQLVEHGGSAAALSDIGVFTPKDYLRRRNDEFVSEVVMAINAGAFPNKKEGLDELFLTFERRGITDEQLSLLTRRLGRAIAILDTGSAQLRKTRFRNKSDCYSLLVFFARHGDHLPRDSSHVDGINAIMEVLAEFSSLVNQLKRVEGTGGDVNKLGPPESVKPALSYLRAVERAASDRLSRVRRNDALETLLGPTIAALPLAPLSKDDEVWRLAGAELEQDPDDDGDADADELRSVQETLLSDE